MPEHVCPECQQPVETVRWNNPGGVNRPPRWITTLVCRRCVLAIHHVDVPEKGPTLPFGWKPISASSECIVCGRRYRDHPYYSDRHECPASVEAGRASVDNVEDRDRRPSLAERLAEGFRILEDRSIDPEGGE